MTEPEDLEPYAVFGLYRYSRDPFVCAARDTAHASRQFHDHVPGFEGTVLYVKSLRELTDGSST